MKEKLLALAQKAKALALSAESKWPFAVGIALGYICHAEIQLALNVVGSVVKEVLKLL